MCLKIYFKRFKCYFLNLKTQFSTVAYWLWFGFALFFLPSSLAGAAELSKSTLVNSFIAPSTPIAISFMLSILVLKVTAFVLGYMIVRLGHDTLIKGVTGEIDFGFSGSGFKTKLKAASPGALFVLMGAAIIIWGITVEKPMQIKMLSDSIPISSEAPTDGGGKLHRSPVPD